MKTHEQEKTTCTIKQWAISRALSDHYDPVSIICRLMLAEPIIRLFQEASSTGKMAALAEEKERLEQQARRYSYEVEHRQDRKVLLVYRS